MVISGDFLSPPPVHLVQKYDKSHRRIEGKFRCIVDISAVNKIFERLPCAIHSEPGDLRLVPTEAEMSERCSPKKSKKKSTTN